MVKRPKNKDVRPREYLTSSEVDRLIKAARISGRHHHRDSTMILVGYIHGFRISELLGLKWAQINFETGSIDIARLKRGVRSIHPMPSKEIRALRRLQKESIHTPYVFISEYKVPLSPSTFQRIIKRAGEQAGFDFPIHPHMLRHAIACKLVNDGHDIRVIQHYLGHRNIQHTVRYTELITNKFDSFWP